jgi:16S rRNA (guanine527-N7)-methyltransferase
MSKRAPAEAFDEAAARAQLEAGLAELGLTLAAGCVGAQIEYLQLLARWNEAYNLTALRTPRQMVAELLLDALVALPYLPEGRVIDVGSGAGVPGLPLALARPHQSFYLLDSTGKKARFVQQVIMTLRVPNVIVVHSRVEHFRPQPPADVVISRAFATLSDMVRLTDHLLGPEGVWLAWKGGSVDQELVQLSPHYEVLDNVPVTVPGVNAQRRLVLLQRRGGKDI